MKIEDLEKHATCYRIAKLLGVTPTSIYAWKKTGKIPPLRVYQLKEMKPEWFNSKGEVK
jgi:predicted transcriptional regulator